MKRSQLPRTAFIDPLGGNQAEIERLFQEVLVLVLNHLKNAGNRSPLRPVDLLFDRIEIPDAPLLENELIEQLKNILAGSMNAANPSFIGHMDSMPATFSILGEAISAAINNNMLSLEMSPVFSHLESRLLAEFAALFGLGEGSGGMMLSGGSLANLQALAVARNVKFNVKFNVLQQRITLLTHPPVLFASEAAHTSLQKAAMLLGLGASAVMPIKTNANSQMDIGELKNAIAYTQQAGKIPFCIVGTAGTTTTGNIDPLLEISQIAREYKLWFHVDAAYGGALILSENQSQRLIGIERADSILNS